VSDNTPGKSGARRGKRWAIYFNRGT
jgi:hypothetical protein